MDDHKHESINFSRNSIAASHINIDFNPEDEKDFSEDLMKSMKFSVNNMKKMKKVDISLKGNQNLLLN